MSSSKRCPKLDPTSINISFSNYRNILNMASHHWFYSWC